MHISTSQLVGSTASAFVAIFGLVFLTRKVARAREFGGSQSSGDRRHRSLAKVAPAFAIGMLDIAIPRDDRPGGSFPRTMINDACIQRAVQEVSRKLVINVRDTGSVASGKVRAYVYDLYREVYDAACAVQRPHLDVRVLLPKEAVSSNRISASSGTDSGAWHTWSTKEAAELQPDLEVVLSDEPEYHSEVALNSHRVEAGMREVHVVSLAPIAEKAFHAEYYYAEDTLAVIPLFTNVACGGTFDRLHGGHKKLLSFAASMCGGTLTVGVTSDAMLKSKANHHMVASLSDRLEGVRDFLRTLNPELRTRVEGITDPFGPPVVEEAFDCIVVSSETVAGAERINELRVQKGFRPLAVAVTRRTSAATMSSTYLRQAKKQS